MVTAYIGFGANLGDPIQQILDARRLLLAHSGVSNLINSSLYLTSPVGYSGQAEFVNCVSSVQTGLSAHSLLDIMQETENQLGRKRDPKNKNASRLIDLDLLLFGTESLSDERLVVPHPRLEQRLFTLLPLSELSPSLQWSESKDVSTILEQGYQSGLFDDQTIHKLT